MELKITKQQLDRERKSIIKRFREDNKTFFNTHPNYRITVRYNVQYPEEEVYSAYVTAIYKGIEYPPMQYLINNRGLLTAYYIEINNLKEFKNWALPTEYVGEETEFFLGAIREVFDVMRCKYEKQRKELISKYNGSLVLFGKIEGIELFMKKIEDLAENLNIEEEKR